MTPAAGGRPVAQTQHSRAADVSRHVVVGFDGTKRGRAAVSRAIAIAKRKGDCDIVVVCTHDRPADFSGAPFLLGRLDDAAWRREWEQETSEELEHEVLRIRLAGVEARSACSLEDPAKMLRDIAKELDAEYIVLPDDSGGLIHDLLVGSIVRRLRRSSRVPVVVVNDDR